MGGQLWVFIGPVCGRLVLVRALRWVITVGGHRPCVW